MKGIPLTFCMRLKIVLTQARVDDKKALVWGDPDQIHVHPHKDAASLTDPTSRLLRTSLSLPAPRSLSGGTSLFLPLPSLLTMLNPLKDVSKGRKRASSSVMSAVSVVSTPVTLPHSDFLSVFVSLKQQIPCQRKQSAGDQQTKAAYRCLVLFSMSIFRKKSPSRIPSANRKSF